MVLTVEGNGAVVADTPSTKPTAQAAAPQGPTSPAVGANTVEAPEPAEAPRPVSTPRSDRSADGPKVVDINRGARPSAEPAAADQPPAPAAPSVRRMARELGVEIDDVPARDPTAAFRSTM